MRKMSWLIALMLLYGCGHTTIQGTQPAPVASPTPGPPIGSQAPDEDVASNPIGISIESPITTPRLDDQGNRLGEIGNYTVSPGQTVQLIARMSDGSRITWRALNDDPSNIRASIDDNGRVTFLRPGPVSVVAASPNNLDRIAWIAFAVVAPALPVSPIALPKGTTLAGPQPQAVDEFYRGAKALMVTNQEDWKDFWASGIQAPAGGLPSMPEIDFQSHDVLAFRYYVRANEREPVITNFSSGERPTIELVVPTKSNWLIEDPVTGPEMPAHLMLWVVPKTDLSKVRIDIHTSRLTGDILIAPYSRAELENERPMGPLVPTT